MILSFHGNHHHGSTTYPLPHLLTTITPCWLVHSENTPVEMKKVELIFIPLPLLGHLIPTVGLAKLLVDRDDRFSITLLIMKLPRFENPVVTSFLHSVSASVSGPIRVVHLPEPPSSDSSNSHPSSSLSRSAFVHNLMENQKPLVRNAVLGILRSSGSGPLGGIVIDPSIISMMDVAHELSASSYVFFTGSAAFLALMFHLQTLKDHHGVDVTEFGRNSDIELAVPGFLNLLPARVLPAAAVDKEGGGSTVFLNRPRRFREAKGILINTFRELESHVVDSFGNDTRTPPIYPIGPLLNLKEENPDTKFDVIHWLDDQPPSSVVYLCFGSLGAFNKGQIMEIANGLESSGCRFLWTLRAPPQKNEIASHEYTKFDEVLPKGFLDRTSKVGKVIGWASQTLILAHFAIGGFISHCGWNSILESIWYGVPIVTWPMHGEQQLNAFQIVRELGMAIEIKENCVKEVCDLINAQEIKTTIRSLMDDDCDVKRKIKETRLQCLKAQVEGGSSNSYLQDLIHNIVTNMS